MAATATVTVAPGFDGEYVAGKQLTFYATVTNTGTLAATLNSMSAYCAQPGVTLEQPNFWVQGAAPFGSTGQPSMPVLAASGALAVRFSAMFPMPCAAGPSTSSQATPVNAVAQEAFPVGSPFQLWVQATLTDSSGSTVVVQGGWQSGLFSRIDPYPRGEGGTLDFRQGSNLLGVFPGWP